jgi:hypothetical protein
MNYILFHSPEEGISGLHAPDIETEQTEKHKDGNALELSLLVEPRQEYGE